MIKNIKFNHKYPFLYLLIPLISGIICTSFVVLPIGISVILLILILISYFFSRPLTEIFILLLSFSLGNNVTIHKSLPKSYEDSIYIEAVCTKTLRPDNYILSSKGYNFYLNNHQEGKTFRQGDSLYFFAKIIPLTNTGNPLEYNYNIYLKRQGIHYRLYPTSSILQHGQSQDILTFFNKQRIKLLEKTNILTTDTICRSLIDAMCLGYKNDIVPEIKSSFLNTGAIHLLSISGLHVGIIYALIIFLFNKLRLKRSKLFMLALFPLWSYACLSGLSSSVVRASLLLSFVTIGKVFCRTYNPINILAASAFVTLIIQPSALYSLSFQLSYSAYCGIMLLSPILMEIGKKWSIIPKNIYNGFCITISAQLPTLPITAYYFHSINLNAFVSNIIAVPLTTLFIYCATLNLILPIAISKILIPFTKFLSHCLIIFLENISQYMINIEHLYPSTITILLLSSIIIVTTLYIKYRKTVYINLNIIMLSILLIISLFQNYYFRHKQEIMVFNYYNKSAILLNQNGKYHIINDQNNTINHLHPYIIYNNLDSTRNEYGIIGVNSSWIPPILILKNDTIMILKKNMPTQGNGNIWIITNNIIPDDSAKVSKIKRFPQRIILDGSNNSFCYKKWEKFCKVHNLEISYTRHDGPIVLKGK